MTQRFFSRSYYFGLALVFLGLLVASALVSYATRGATVTYERVDTLEAFLLDEESRQLALKAADWFTENRYSGEWEVRGESFTAAADGRRDRYLIRDANQGRSGHVLVDGPTMRLVVRLELDLEKDLIRCIVAVPQ